MQGAGTPAGAGMPGAAGAAGTGADMSTLGQQAAQNVSTPILLMELAAMTDPLIFQQMGGASTLQSLLKPVTAAQTSENALQTLLGANAQGQIGGQNSPFAQAGGAQGKLGGAGAGLVSRLFGGGETSAYGQQAQQLQNQINQALNQAGLSNVNLQLPQITQSPQAAQAQYNLLQSILQPLASGGQIPQNVLQTISQQ